MTDNTKNVISDESSNMSESERLAAAIQNMIFAAVSTPEKEEAVAPTVEDSAILPENEPEALIEETPALEEVAQEEVLQEEENVEPIEVEEPTTEEVASEEELDVEVEEVETEAVEESETEISEDSEAEVAEDVEQAPVEVFVKTEAPEENCIKKPVISQKVAPAVAELLNNIDENLSRIIVAAPSEKEDSSTVALLVAKGLSSSKKVLLVNCKPSDTLNVCPTDIENLFCMSAGEDMSIDREGFDTVVYAMDGVVNPEALTDDCGVLLAVKPKVTHYGAYRKALKSLHKSQAKILGAIIL